MKVLSDVQPAVFRIVPKLSPSFTAVEQLAERVERTVKVGVYTCLLECVLDPPGKTVPRYMG